MVFLLAYQGMALRGFSWRDSGCGQSGVAGDGENGGSSSETLSLELQADGQVPSQDTMGVTPSPGLSGVIKSSSPLD